MKRHTFSITIDAPREKVWDVLWNDKTYRQWTAPFSEGSYAETDWQQGSNVRFLGTDGNGMVSTIRKRTDNEYMFIEHLGMVKDGVEDIESEAIQPWKGAEENYTLSTMDGKTELTVETDIAEECLDEFQAIWPQALQQVKELSEKRTPMKAQQVWINLPVKDIRKSKAFFREIGFTPNSRFENTDDAASFLIGEHDFVMMLFREETFKKFTRNEVANTTRGTECLINIDAPNRESVDEMARMVQQAGGTLYAHPGESEGWMYAFGFADPDGHRWSVLHMDTDKMPQ